MNFDAASASRCHVPPFVHWGAGAGQYWQLGMTPQAQSAVTLPGVCQ